MDIIGGKMYWTDGETDKIQRANLDGTNVQDLVTGLTTPLGIVLDVIGGKMYWTDGETDKIQRANLDGTNVQDLVTGLSNIDFGITLSTAALGHLSVVREDVNADGVVDVQDLVYVMQHYGWTGQNNADVNGNGIVDVNDLILVAAVLNNVAAAPVARAQVQDLLAV